MSFWAPVIAVALGIGVFLMVRAVIAPPRTESELLEARLAQFAEGGRAISSLNEVEMSLPFFERAIRPVFDKLSQGMSRRTPAATMQLLQEKINLAGRPWGMTVGGFQVLRIMSAVFFTVIFFALGSLPFFGLSGANILLPALIGLILGTLIPQMMLSSKIRARQKEILLALPSALDLLTISVEAGLGFDAALARVAEKYQNALALEFNQALQEIRLGRPRLEALDDLGRRCHIEELNNFCQAIIQSETLGVGIANVLRIQSEEIRRRRRQRAEEAGQKAPLKMLFPMIGCIFPTLFIVLLGPAVLQVSSSLFGH